MNACWYTKGLVGYCLFSCMYVHAGRVYYFDKERFCAKVDAASSWKELLPYVDEQVRWHMYCAERLKTDLFDYQYFQRDWDEPLVAAGNPKDVHGRLIELINQLDRFSLATLHCYARKEEDLAQDSKVNKEKRLKRIENWCRCWMASSGKLSGISEKYGDKDLAAADECRKDFLTIAYSIRWVHEQETNGMNSFTRYLLCSEKIKHSNDSEKVQALCRALAMLVNSHFDLYGTPSSFSVEKDEGEQDQTSLLGIKTVIKDSAQRFDKLLGFSVVSVAERHEAGCDGVEGEWLTLRPGEQIKPFLKKLSDNQLKCRVPFVENVLALISDEDAKPATPRSRLMPSTPTRSTPRPFNWHPPTKVEKIWERLQLIDEIRLEVDPEEFSQKEISCVTEFPGGQNVCLPSSLTPIASSSHTEALPANVFLVPPTSHNTSADSSADRVAKTVSLAQRVHSSSVARFSTTQLLPPPPYDETTPPPPPYDEAALPPYDNSWALGVH